MAAQVRAALAAGSDLLNKLPYPAKPDHHFVVDPDKWDFYAMDTYRIIGEDALAKRNAEEVIRRSVNAEGVLVAPMRNTEAQLTLAVIAARQGDAEQRGRAWSPGVAGRPAEPPVAAHGRRRAGTGAGRLRRERRRRLPRAAQ